MRAIWKGAVSFGLVSIAVRLYSATDEKNVRFHQVHYVDGGRIKYQRICSVCGEQVEYADIAKGYDLGGGEMVILTDEDFADLPLASSHAVDVLQFVPAEQIDPIHYQRSYYLEPDGVGVKPYALLRDALAGSDRVAVVKVALRQREQLGVLRVRDDVLVMHTMLWPDEVRAAEFDFLGEDVKVRPQELAMANSLIDSMTADFDPQDFTDDYREALESVIEAKVAGREVVAPPEIEAEPSTAGDLMAALRASVERAKSGPRAVPAPAADAEERPVQRAAKKAPAKKAEKPAAKKAAKTAKTAKKAAEKPAERRRKSA